MCVCIYIYICVCVCVCVCVQRETREKHAVRWKSRQYRQGVETP